MRGFGVLVLASLTVLAACGDQSHRKSQSTQAPAEEAYQPPESNLLINPDFALSPNGSVNAWSLTQHSGEPSYKLSVEAGVATLERINTEPWGKLAQTLRPEAVLPLQGKRLRFSAELKAEFNQDYGAPFQESGMGLLLSGVPVGGFSRVNVADVFEPAQYTNGSADWRRYSVELDIPSTEAFTGLRLQLRYVMANGGSLRIRRPYLIEISQGE